MDDVIFQDGACCLKISVAGVDRDTGTVTSERFRLTVYAYDAGPPVRPLFTAELDVSQATRLYGYLDSISIVRERGSALSGRFVEIRDGVPREVIEAFLGHPDLLGDPEVVRSVLKLNPELTRAIIETELSAFDVQSLAYRRQQLAVMRRLLDDQDFFGQQREKLGISGKEGVWQRFFEDNQWIFGFALHYMIGEGVYPDRLEQVVAGYSVAGAGKRADALAPADTRNPQISLLCGDKDPRNATPPSFAVSTGGVETFRRVGWGRRSVAENGATRDRTHPD